MLSLKPQLGLVSRFTRSFHISSSKLQESTSLFGDVTAKPKDKPTKNKKRDLVDSMDNQAQGDKPFYKERITLRKDPELQRFIGHAPTPAAEKYLSPLKLQIYNANVAKNGFFKNNDIVKLSNGEKYQLKLSKKEIEAFEPSIYLKTFRIKHSVKKATTFLKLINRMEVKKAITQAHFNQKQIARDVAELLEKGLNDAKQLNLNPDELYLDQIWAGKDGHIIKRVDIKGRGRTGVIEHPHIHIRAILKGEQTKKRLAYEQEQKELRKAPYMQLPSSSLRWRPEGFYKW